MWKGGGGGSEVENHIGGLVSQLQMRTGIIYECMCA